MTRIIAFIFGLTCYSIGMAGLVFFILFTAGILIPFSTDSGPETPVALALAINFGLVGLFAVQHTIMARKGFKEVWTKIVPKSVERSIFVLISGVIIAASAYFWRPIDGVIWEVTDPALVMALQGLCLAGFGLTVFSSFLIDHFDLFGLRQVWLNLRKKAYTQVEMGTPFLYGLVRHPMMTGILIAVWATPSMTGGHLSFAVAWTAYIFVGYRFEERDLEADFGDSYRDYQTKVGAVIPGIGKKAPRSDAQTANG